MYLRFLFIIVICLCNIPSTSDSEDNCPTAGPNPKIKSFMQMFGNLVIRTASLNVTLYFCNAFATKYGDEFIAAYTIAINLWFLVAFIIDGFGK